MVRIPTTIMSGISPVKIEYVKASTAAIIEESDTYLVAYKQIKKTASKIKNKM